ncbi:hypothetical protein [Ruminococcus sp.]|uniref:hypothetical protein n=1 Tax=Ruminococcus sp. TaxID=41978 RepID=UPI0025E05CC2|nr:hypothetical protein [Ruminococcus sp.]
MKNKIKKIAVVALAVMCVFIVSCVSAFAADDNLTYDQVVSKWGIKYDTSKYPYYVLIRKSNKVDYDFVISQNKNAVDVKNGLAFADSGITYNCFVSRDSYICNTLNNSSSTSLGRLSELTFLSSNYDVKYEGQDKVFFQQPTLLSQLLSLVPGAGEKITGDMGTLTVCGVACLALLIGLSLLPKVLYKFL